MSIVSFWDSLYYNVDSQSEATASFGTKLDCPLATFSEGAVVRFTIRDMLWLTLVVGLAIGWLLSGRYWNSSHRLLTEKNQQLLLEAQQANNQARLANQRADKAWAESHHPAFRNSNPVDALLRRRFQEIAP